MTTSTIRARRSNFSMPVFNAMAAALTAPKEEIFSVSTPAFKCLVPDAAMKYSEPQKIVAIHYNNTTREIRVVGEDTNVRVCKIDRLPSIEFARELYATLKVCKESGEIICFQAAGGFSPNKWFCDIVKG